MALQNVLMIGPREAVGEIASHPGLACKLFVIDDGFKALLGFVKLGVKKTRLAGVYIHQATGRVELPMYFEVLRSIESGMLMPHTPILVGVRNLNEFKEVVTSENVTFVELPVGETKKQVTDALVIQLNAFAASVVESL
jgi:hypothetical protein